MNANRCPGAHACAGALVLTTVWLFVSQASASQVRSVNLEEMTARAGAIFSGRCLDVRTVTDPTIGRDVSEARFEVHRAVKGATGRTVTVRMLSGDDGFADVPMFARGEDVVLFLYRESSLGLRSPVGLGQGRFKVASGKNGRSIAVNEFGNRNLLRELSPMAKARLAHSHQARDDDQQLDPDALLDMAEALAAP